MRWLLFLFALAFLVPAGQAAHGHGLGYYLHAEGECADQGPELFMDQTDSAGDQDGCGFVGAAVDGFDAEYPGRGALNHSLTSASGIQAHIFIQTAQPDSFKVDATVTAGDAACTGSSPEQQVLGNPVNPPFVDFQVACRFTGAARPAEEPTLGLLIHAKVTYFMGYEGNHASRVDFTGIEEPPAPSPTNSSAPPPEGESPALPWFALAAAVGISVAWVRRRP